MANFLAESKFLYLQKREKNKAITTKLKIKILFAISQCAIIYFSGGHTLYLLNDLRTSRVF